MRPHSYQNPYPNDSWVPTNDPSFGYPHNQGIQVGNVTYKSRNDLIIFIGTIIIIALIILIPFVYNLQIQSRNKARRTARTTATIAYIYYDGLETGEGLFEGDPYPVVRFTDKTGEEHEETCRENMATPSHSYERGDAVTIEYEPDDPRNVAIVSE